MPRERVARILLDHGVRDPVVLVGIRGYYLDTMGRPGMNDRGIYDDAMIVTSPSIHASFNANTDPSITRPGIATLKPGVHPYCKGRHGISRGPGYPALRPATPGERLPVVRDGIGDDFGVAINIHKGGYYSTSSEGCQTIFPDQWEGFINLVYEQMDRYGVSTIPYVLVEEKR
jgi:lysozyme